MIPLRQVPPFFAFCADPVKKALPSNGHIATPRAIC
jgi:hypothetical protein